MTGKTDTRTAPLMRVKAKNVLSFGSSGLDLELSNLNVVIGPNGSGKSNLFEVLRLLQAAPHDLSDPVRTGGGISEWIWKGQPKSLARVEAVVENPGGNQNLRHVIEFRESGRRFTLEDERIENEHTRTMTDPSRTSTIGTLAVGQCSTLLGMTEESSREKMLRLTGRSCPKGKILSNTRS